MKPDKLIPKQVNFYLFVYLMIYYLIVCCVLFNLGSLGVKVYFYYLTNVFSFTQKEFLHTTKNGAIAGLIIAVSNWILSKHEEIQRKKAAKQPPQQE